MFHARLFPALTLVCILALAALAGPPTLTAPENKATDQPSDLTLSWEAGSPTNYVADGGFEKGAPQWAFPFPWRLTTDAATAYEGTHFVEVQLKPNNLRGGDELFLVQKIALPKKGTEARLQWRDYHTGVGAPDTRPRFRVEVQVQGSQAGQVLFDVPCGFGSIDPWNQHELDLSAYLGKTFELIFSISNSFGATKTIGARVDDVHIEVTPESVQYEVYLGPTPNLGPAQLLGKTTDASWNLSGLAAGSTNCWKVIQITDGVRVSSPMFQFVVGGSVPVEAPPLRVELSGGQLHLHALTQAGGFYQFEQAAAPDSDAWQPIGDEITGDGSETSVDVPVDAEVQFFRIRITR